MPLPSLIIWTLPPVCFLPFFLLHLQGLKAADMRTYFLYYARLAHAHIAAAGGLDLRRLLNAAAEAAETVQRGCWSKDDVEELRRAVQDIIKHWKESINKQGAPIFHDLFHLPEVSQRQGPCISLSLYSKEAIFKRLKSE